MRRGAKLDAAGKAQLGKINQALAGLFTEFSAKVLADENTWTVLRSARATWRGCRPSLVAAARRPRPSAGSPGKWAVVNTRSSVDPFLTYSTRRDLREKVWKAFKSRGDNGDANDTNAIIAAIVKLRAERAKLLGYADARALAAWPTPWPSDPQTRAGADDAVWPAAVARVNEEVADMQAIADKESGGAAIEPWDYRYYAEKVRKAKYDLDSRARSSPTSSSDNMRRGGVLGGRAAATASRSREITGTVPVFHPDVRVWEVTDTATGAHVGLFYFDNFARAGKRSGAWVIALPHAEHVRRPASRRSRRTTTTSSRAPPASRC